MERRAEILRFVGEEVVRQKASGCRTVINEEGGRITITRWRSMSAHLTRTRPLPLGTRATGMSPHLDAL